MTEPDAARVTVIVLTHNRRDEVLGTVARLVALPEHPPVIVVDNASADGTAAAIGARFPDVDLVALPSNDGAAARNVGVRRARTPYVALSDDDTWWRAGALGAAVDILDRYPRLAVLTAHVLVGAGDRDDGACVEMAASPLPRAADLPGVPVLGFLAGACVVRRDAFLDAGGFEPRFFLGGEEELLAVDLATRGWGVTYVDTVRAHHHPSPRRDSASRRRLLARNVLWFTWLRRPARTALRRTLEIVADSRSDGARLRGCTDALAGLPWVLARRRVVPDHVERHISMVERARRGGPDVRPGRLNGTAVAHFGSRRD